MALLERWLEETAPASQPGRPLVTLSYAQSIDGSIAKRRGQPTALSGPESQTITHQLRAAHDAILVGIGTVLSDDPQLTVRLAEGQNPRPVVLDSQLRIPLNSKLLDQHTRPIIFCASDAPSDSERSLVDRGARVERQDKHFDMLDLPELLARLSGLNIHSVMVEGGGQVLASFLADDLSDRALITISPQYLDGYKIPVKEMGDGLLPKMKDIQIEDAGKDIVLYGRIEKRVHAEK